MPAELCAHTQGIAAARRAGIEQVQNDLVFTLLWVEVDGNGLGGAVILSLSGVNQNLPS